MKYLAETNQITKIEMKVMKRCWKCDEKWARRHHTKTPKFRNALKTTPIKVSFKKSLSLYRLYRYIYISFGLGLIAILVLKLLSLCDLDSSIFNCVDWVT